LDLVAGDPNYERISLSSAIDIYYRANGRAAIRDLRQDKYSELSGSVCPGCGQNDYCRVEECYVCGFLYEKKQYHLVIYDGELFHVDSDFEEDALKEIKKAKEKYGYAEVCEICFGRSLELDKSADELVIEDVEDLEEGELYHFYREWPLDSFSAKSKEEALSLFKESGWEVGEILFACRGKIYEYDKVSNRIIPAEK
jgi:hypothetical protein